MTSKIVQQPAGFFGFPAFSPSRLRNRPPPLETRFEPKWRPERVLSQQALNCQEVTIPSPILKNGEQSFSLSSCVNKLASLRRRECEWLVDHNVQTCGERIERERYVSPVRRSDNDHIEVGRMIPEMRRCFEDLRNRMCFPRLRLSFGITGHNRCEIQPRSRIDEWSVKDCAREPVTDEANAKGSTRSGVGVRQYRSVSG